MSLPEALALWLAKRFPAERALCQRIGHELASARLDGDTVMLAPPEIHQRLMACGAASNDPAKAPMTSYRELLAWSVCAQDEACLATGLLALAGAAAHQPDPAQLPWIRMGKDISQDHAVRTVVERRLAVIVGGPGTGKTTTVLRALSAMLAHRPLRIRLAAPTGKAAARLRESIERGLDRALHAHHLVLREAAAEATTVHRLIGWDPGVGRFRLGLRHPLVADLVVVDEASMVDVHMAAALIRALPPACRLVLVGDDAQLPSVEAGAVLRDVVQAAGEGGSLQGCLARLTKVHRQTGDAVGLRTLAPALRLGDILATEVALSGGHQDIKRVAHAEAWPVVRTTLEPWIQAVVGAADPLSALAELGRMLVLCATREGAWSVADLHRRIEAMLGARVDGAAPLHAHARPILITANDHRLGLANGDLGVLWSVDGYLSACFPDGQGGLRHLAPARLPACETGWVTTVHKAQGSEALSVIVILPPAPHPVANRELLYTAVTRARERVLMVGDERLFAEVLDRQERRQTGLLARLDQAAATT